MNSTDDLSVLKQHYIEQATAPLDGMWLLGFVPMAKHFGIYEAERLVGYFCVNDAGYALQFYLAPNYHGLLSDTFDSIVAGVDSPAGQLQGAFVSTAEPEFLSQCLDRFSGFKVNALMYQHGNDVEKSGESAQGSLIPIGLLQLPLAVDFAVINIGAPAEWVRGYYSNLIMRQELYGLWQSDQLVATGESRLRDDYQTDYADVGMIVAKPERGKGLGTQILRKLVAMNQSKGLKSICSTEKSNVAAQKSILRAGFLTHHRILQFHNQ